MPDVLCGELGTTLWSPRKRGPSPIDTWKCNLPMDHDFNHRAMCVKSNRSHRNWDSPPGVITPYIPGSGVWGDDVYFAQRSGDGAIKIGHSVDWQKAFRQIQRGSGKLDLLALIPDGGQPMEHFMHQVFRVCRIDPKHEWFDPTDKLIYLVEHLEHTYCG